MGSPTFLCVDDEPSVLSMEKALLESAGFRVLAATSGRQAISIFSSEAVDVVLMDYWLPGMNGIQVAQAMKQLKPDVPILFLSAYSELPGETSGLAYGWVRKGEESAEQFLARLRDLVSSRGDRRAAS
jgi:CheY-like chemotaxis protein